MEQSGLCDSQNCDSNSVRRALASPSSPPCALASLAARPSLLTHSIAGEELSGFVSEVPIPDQAMAPSKAQHEATTASQPLTREQLERRAANIIDERRRCVVVPVEALQGLLRAGISVNIG